MQENKQQYPAHAKVISHLTAVLEELPDVPFYVNLHEMCKSVKATAPKAEVFRSAIINAGEGSPSLGQHTANAASCCSHVQRRHLLLASRSSTVIAGGTVCWSSEEQLSAGMHAAVAKHFLSVLHALMMQRLRPYTIKYVWAPVCCRVQGFRHPCHPAGLQNRCPLLPSVGHLTVLGAGPPCQDSRSRVLW